MSRNTQFDDLSALLGRLAVPIGASETHGLLCGLLSAQPSSSAKKLWLAELLESAELEPGTLASRVDEIKALDAWYSHALESLNDSEFGFNPLLPEDHVAIAERLRALGDFCAGFCYGLGLATAGRGNTKLPEDTAEIIKDFNEIDSTVTTSLNEADEEMLSELSEYVRVGVLLIIEELQPVAVRDNQVH